MHADWINPFIGSTVKTFETMLGLSLERGAPYLKKDNQPENEVSGLMSLDGDASGIVVVSLDRGVAINATKHILGACGEGIDGDVIDVVCEITNMISGGANNCLGHLNMKIGLPTVVAGKDHVICYPSGVETLSIPFESSWGPICVDASIKKTGAGQQALSGASNELATH